MRSITIKLILAFLGIGLISISMIVLLARQNTRTEFNRFIAGDRGDDLVAELVNLLSNQRLVGWSGHSPGSRGG